MEAEGRQGANSDRAPLQFTLSASFFACCIAGIIFGYAKGAQVWEMRSLKNHFRFSHSAAEEWMLQVHGMLKCKGDKGCRGRVRKSGGAGTAASLASLWSLQT